MVYPTDYLPSVPSARKGINSSLNKTMSVSSSSNPVLGTVTLSNGTVSAQLFVGSGAPTGTTAPQGSVYLRTDGSSTSTRLYVNTTGSTVWTNVTTAA